MGRLARNHPGASKDVLPSLWPIDSFCRHSRRRRGCDAFQEPPGTSPQRLLPHSSSYLSDEEQKGVYKALTEGRKGIYKTLNEKGLTLDVKSSNLLAVLTTYLNKKDLS